MAIIITALLVIWQLREMRRTTHAQAFAVAVGILQDEKAREARKVVFALHSRQTRSRWTKREKAAVEVVCYTYDLVGQMVRHGMLPKRIIIESWGPSLRNSWPVLSRLITEYRGRFAAPEYWDDCEWFAAQAQTAFRRSSRGPRKHVAR